MKLILSLLFLPQLHCHPLSPSSLLSHPTGYSYLTVGACDTHMEELMDTYPIPNSATALETCQKVCEIIESCNFFKYNQEDGKCSLFHHRFLESCQLFGAQASPNIQTLLREANQRSQDSSCDSFVRENCTYTGNVVFKKTSGYHHHQAQYTITSVQCQELLLHIGPVFKAKYFVYDSDQHSCVWYDSPIQVNCDAISGPVLPKVQDCKDITTIAPVCGPTASLIPKCLCGDANAANLNCERGSTCDQADATAPKCIPPVCDSIASSVPKCLCGDANAVNLKCEQGDTCDTADATAPKCIPPVCDAIASLVPKCLCGDSNALNLNCEHGYTCDKADANAPKCIPPVCAAIASLVPKCLCGDANAVNLNCERGYTCDKADATAPKCIPPECAATASLVPKCICGDANAVSLNCEQGYTCDTADVNAPKCIPPVCEAIASLVPKCLCGDANAANLKCEQGDTCDTADATAPKCIPPVCGPTASLVPKCLCGDANAANLNCEQGYMCDKADSDAPKCIPPPGKLIFITGASGYRRHDYDDGGHNDPASSCSRSTGNLPDRRAYHSIHAVNGLQIVCGGYHTPTSCISSRSPDGPWTDHSQLTARRYGHSSVTSLGKVHLISGDNGESDTTAETLEGGVWRKRGPLPYTMHIGTCAVNVNDTHVFVTGGDHSRTKSAMWDHELDQWTPMSDMDSGRYKHGCSVLRDEGNTFILVAGGHDGGRLSSSSVYDLSSNSWTSAGNMNYARSSGKIIDNYFIGGGSNGNGGSRADVEVFDLQSRKWTMSDLKMKTSRFGFAAVEVDRASYC